VPGAYEKIVLKESSKALQEVVVVGYGSQMKRNMTGSVSTVLNGQVAGLSVAYDTISIRGLSSIPGQEPLYVVDGEILKNLDGLDKASIGEISVLKDAAATRFVWLTRC